MNTRKRLDSTKIIDAATSATQSSAYPISDYENMMLTVATANNWECTIKVVWSFQFDKPDFSQSADVDNQWSYISIRDLEDWTNIDWTTGITLSWTDVVNSYLVNTPWLRWIWVVISSYTAGDITVTLNGFSS